MSAPPQAKTDLSKHIIARIEAVAPTISHQELGLVYHRPEQWAEPSQCFENAARKVRQDSGRTQFGWTFHHRLVEAFCGPGYLFATHHAVWHAPDGRLVNVTPYPDAKHYPLPRPGGDILFLVDDKAQPIVTDKLVAPLPLRFFPLSDEDGLVAYVKQLNDDEQEKCRRITR